VGRKQAGGLFGNVFFFSLPTTSSRNPQPLTIVSVLYTSQLIDSIENVTIMRRIAQKHQNSAVVSILNQNCRHLRTALMLGMLGTLGRGQAMMSARRLSPTMCGKA
jgi:hypothetical protein